MRYITHRRYRGRDLSGAPVNIRYGTAFDTIGDFIATPEGRGLCAATSETAHQYFARDSDGQGLTRGALTYAIAYAPRERRGADGRRQRFSGEEIELLTRDWGRFLRQDVDTILFNDEFFTAHIYDLQRLADALHIKVRR